MATSGDRDLAIDRQSAAVHEVLGDVDGAATQVACELGATVAALLMQQQADTP